MIPKILTDIKTVIDDSKLQLSKTTPSGRINSAVNESQITTLLLEKFPLDVKGTPPNHWFDISVRDVTTDGERWLPVNIKITTGKTSDNMGNLAPCVFAYTTTMLSLDRSYKNGKLSTVLINALKTKAYNTDFKKDYWFLIILKDNNRVIINSMLGLTHLNKNSNNMPFQINWSKNMQYVKKSNILQAINLFIDTIKKTKKSWQANLIDEMQTIEIAKLPDEAEPQDASLQEAKLSDEAEPQEAKSPDNVESLDIVESLQEAALQEAKLPDEATLRNEIESLTNSISAVKIT